MMYKVRMAEDSYCNLIPAIKRNVPIIRASIVKMAYLGKETHLSSALSCVELLACIFGYWIKEPWSKTERFILSKGHACAAMYASMAAFGWIPKWELKTYAVPGSRLPNHPCKKMFPKLEFSSGSLGNCLGVATGILYACRLKGSSNTKICVLLGDGECNEGSIWEAVTFAVGKHINNLIIMVDNNNTQAIGRHDEITGYTKLEDKFKSFGCEVAVINGHDVDEIVYTMDTVPLSSERPTAIIAKTVSGYGISFMENDQSWFYKIPDENHLNKAIKELRATPLF